MDVGVEPPIADRRTRREGKMAKIYRRLIVFVEALLAASVFTLVCLVLIQAFCRYYAISVPWVEEAARGSFIWAVMLGASVAADRQSHYVTGFVQDALPGIPRLVVATIGNVIAIGFLVLLAVLGLDYAKGSLSSTFITLGISRTWIYAAVPVGATLMAISFARHSWTAVQVSRAAVREASSSLHQAKHAAASETRAASAHRASPQEE